MARSVLSAAVRRSTHQEKSFARISRFLAFEKLVLFMLVLLPLAEVGRAQTDSAAGILPFSTHVGGQYDSIDLATSNILITIPVRSKIGKIPLNFTLTENNHIFRSCGGNYCSPSTSVTMAGHSFAAGLDDTLNWSAPRESTSCNGHSYNYLYKAYVVTDETGAQHPFPSGLEVDLFGCYPSPVSGTTTDGSGYTIVLTTGGHADVYDRSGNHIAFSGGTPSTVTDPDGIQYSKSWSGDTATYTDPLGTTFLSYNYVINGSPTSTATA